ncbi:MAG TPA: C25 family cysteine peptidase [Thermoanaerobaculia bacterium]|nr:C25 family cysteine peptidase [Thermoanaerobaculia bacterium]
MTIDAPTGTPAVQATATATVSGGQVTAITMTNFGSGYVLTPTVTINGGNADATAAATLGSGFIFTAGTAGTNAVINLTKTKGSCSVTSTAVPVTVNASPSITGQPSSRTICTVPGSVTFSATASGADASTPYQWQISTDNGSTFSNISGANSASYTFTAVAGDDGKQYRVIAFNASGCSVTSNAATLHVSCNPDLELTTNSDSPDPVFAGNNITYTQLITNVSSTQTAHNVTLSETTPVNTTFVSMTPPAGWTCGTLPAVGGTGSIVCTDGSNLAGGANSGNFILVLNVNATTADGTTITETASTATTDTEPVLTNNSNTATTLAQKRIDIAVTKTSDASDNQYGPGFIYPGNPATTKNVNWTVTMTNNGPSRATGVTLVDQVPTGFTYARNMAATLTNSGSGYTSAPAVNLSGGNGSGASAKAKLGGFITVINVTNGGSGYTSVPIVTISGGSPTTNATATASIDDAGHVTSITITNEGAGYTSTPSVSFGGPGTGAAATATVLGTPGKVAQVYFDNVGVGYTTPPSATLSSGGGSGALATPSICVYNSGNGILTCNVGTLDAGQTTTMTVFGTVGPGAGQTINSAAPTYNETDSNTANDTGSSMVTVLAPTVVKMLVMDAVQTKNNVSVTWQTSFEQDNLGFYVWRQLTNGQKQRVNKNIVIGSALFTGKKIAASTRRSYRFVDTAPPAGQYAQYYVEDVDIKGVHTMHGPITPRVSNTTVGAPVTDPDPSAGSLGGIFVTQPGMGVTAPAPSAPAAQRLAQQWNVAATPAAKIIVTQPGWYHVKKSDLVAAGFDPGTISRNIAVWADGIEVPIVIPDGNFGTNDALEFYGTGIDTPTAGGHVYYVTKGIGNALRVQSANGKPGSGAPAPASTQYTFSRVERTIFFTALVNNGDKDNFFGALIWTDPVTNGITVSNIDPNSGTAAMEVVIQGITDDFDHAVDLNLNGHDLGVVRFRGQARNVSNYTIPVSWLTNGDGNTLTFSGQGGDDDLSLVESVKLVYAHRFTADSNALEFAVPAATAVTVTGFTTDNVRVVDLTDPQAPQFLPVSVTAATDGTKSASFATAGSGTRTIFAFGDDRVQAPAQIVVNASSTLNKATNGADLIIISAKDFLTQAASLKAARDAQGISTTIADVQNVYDEFSYGAHGPEAIRAFLQRAKTSWAKAPRYVILLGDSSYDPRNYQGLGNYDFVPTKLVPTAYLKTSSDDWFADFSDAGLAQIAIGRIPVRTADEAAAVINKLVHRSSVSGSWLSNVEIITDRTNGVPFSVAGDQLAALVPAPFTTGRINFAAAPNPSQAVIDAFNGGALLMNYVGHGSVDIWSSDVFDAAAAYALTNGDKLPFVVTMNCLNGYFHDLFQESLAEALLKNGSGGAIGVWASSALTSPDQQLRVNLALYRQLFGGGTSTIGDAILKAKQDTNDIDVRRTWILFGDPTLKLQP